MQTSRAILENALRNFPDLCTPRLRLRRLRMEDARDVFAYASDPQMTPFVFWEPHRSLDDTRDFLERTLKGYTDGVPPTWGIQHIKHGIIIGACAYHEISFLNERAEIGYALARKYWGKGLMTEAVRAVLDYGFMTLHLNRIEARCDVENIGSWRVMEKVGMKFEGVLRQNIILHGRPRTAPEHHPAWPPARRQDVRHFARGLGGSESEIRSKNAQQSRRAVITDSLSLLTSNF